MGWNPTLRLLEGGGPSPDEMKALESFRKRLQHFPGRQEVGLGGFCECGWRITHPLRADRPRMVGYDNGAVLSE